MILAIFIGFLLAGCASTPGELSQAVGGGQVNLTIASSTLDHPPTTITVTIDGMLVATQLLSELSNGPKSHLLKVAPGHREIIARANTGRTKEVFPIFIHEEMEWLKLTYHCDCKGSAHPASVAHFSLEQPQLPADEVQLNR